MERTILHCDCNSFFASVESALNPQYRNVPMAVCGDPEDRHGIVLAKNELAKKYGIQTAETVFSAKKKCPSLVIAPPHHIEYQKYSRLVNNIYSEYTELVEPFGIDESWLDVTASKRLFGTGEEIAHQIRERVKRELGITISVGVSFNKVFAKLGSDYKKPDAVTVISKENFKSIVFPLPVSDLLYVGKKTTEQLLSIGVRTIGNLAETSRELLVKKLGKMGDMLYDYANGLDTTPVSVEGRDDLKSISNGFTFKHDLVSYQECKVGLDFLCDEIGRRLRERHIKCNTVALTIKDTYLVSIQRQRSLFNATDISREISNTAFDILRSEWPEKKPIRMLTVSVSGFVDAANSYTQLDLFTDPCDDTREREKKREETIDEIRKKFGSLSISTGAILDSDIGVSGKGFKTNK